MPRRITSLGEWPASEADAKKGHESDCTGTPSELSPHQSSSGLGGKDSGCGREAPAPEPAALPCLNSNNSNQVSPNKSAKKTGYKLTETIRYMVQKHGIDCIGFFTIGFPDPQPTPREASRRINILNAGVLSEHFLDYVSVYERGGKNKKIHFHFLVVCKQDIRTGADCDAIAHGDYSSANQALRAEWAFWLRAAA